MFILLPDNPCEKWLKAYWGALAASAVAYPIIASAATIFFYFSPGFALPFVPSAYLDALDKSNWYAPVYGAIFALATVILIGLFRSSGATAAGANMRSYGQIKSRQNELKARLSIEDRSDGTPKFIPLSKMKQAIGVTDDGRCSESALREAYGAYGAICRNLHYSQSGLQWALGAGYINTWTEIHLAEEALLEVIPVATIIQEALHDQEAISDSAISNRDSLLEKLIQAVKELDAGASIYFKEHQPDKNYEELKEQFQKHDEMLVKLVNIYKKEHPGDTSFDEIVAAQAPCPPEIERRARGILREIRQMLNSYRDDLREGLVRARNHLLVAIALTGAVTHVLLCISMLLDATPYSNRNVIMAATAFYLVGAVAGLFSRFYNESTNAYSIDDYGLFAARQIAIPLLSGLAGVGGVLVTVLLPVLSGQKLPLLSEIFTLNSQYLLAAAVFGFTPNLLIGSFQQRAQKYVSELESSKAGGTASKR
jgi:hypothetical protein